MGVYSEYLQRNLSFPDLTAERKVQLQRISVLRGKGIIVYAADQTKNLREISTIMDYSDIVPFQDQLSLVAGNEIDIIIETPGGIAEVAEDIVRITRSRFEKVGMIVPGWAKSAGTIFVMAGDEILMGATSALGPIDPQIAFNGKRLPADAFLEGLTKIKAEVQNMGKLNPAYIPILQNISPGEIQNCENAKAFSTSLVKQWLADYKFKYWDTHSDGRPVTLEDKHNRAEEIAKELCDHSKWLTHGRSIKIEDLEKMKLKIVDYSKIPDLDDAISRYYALLRLSFDITNMYKIIETVNAQVMRFAVGGTPVVPGPSPLLNPPPAQTVGSAFVQFKCSRCGQDSHIQINLEPNQPLQPGKLPYPIADNKFKCPHCQQEHDLSPLRLQVEAQSGKRVIT